MMILIFKTKDKEKTDGFPKVWIREAKNLQRADVIIKSMKGGAWDLWRCYEGVKLRKFCNYKI